MSSWFRLWLRRRRLGFVGGGNFYKILYGFNMELLVANTWIDFLVATI
jgi:hypothetical protein